MKKTPTWLLAGAAATTLAAATFAASQALAAADPANDARAAAQQASEDARAAAEDAREAAREARHERHEVRIYRRDGDDVTIVHDGGRDGGREEGFSAMLQLRPDQEPALKAFLEAVRPPHHEHMARAGHDEARTTMQKLDDMQARMAEQTAEMNRKIGAVKAFYAQLDERQKRAFDAMPMVMVAGPNIGPIMVPHAMPIVDRDWPAPPAPPTPPRPPGV